jgi:hypothetical protein
VEDTILVTGVDSRFFLMACLLHQSLKPVKNFFLLDFGLKEEEKAFFKAKGILVDAPVKAGTHPWASKAMLYDYVAQLPLAANIVWIDSDIVVSRNFNAALGDLLAGMAGTDISVAASPEMTIADVMSRFAHLNLWPFIRAHAERKIPFTADYYNSGFIIFRSAAPLKEWSELAKTTPFHQLFDQNLFNLVLHNGVTAQPLPRKTWNFHANDFDDDQAANPLVLHVKSDRAPLHYTVDRCGLAGGQGHGYELRLLNRKHFRDRQFALLEEFVSSERAALSACNLLPSDWPKDKFFITWDMPGNQACPCQSGKPYEQCHG